MEKLIAGTKFGRSCK